MKLTLKNFQKNFKPVETILHKENNVELLLEADLVEISDVTTKSGKTYIPTYRFVVKKDNNTVKRSMRLHVAIDSYNALL